MANDNVDAPLKPTAATSYFRIFAAALLLGPPYVIGMVMAARHFLSPDDAEWLRNLVMALVGLITTGAGGTVLSGRQAKTKAKITSQLAAQVSAALPSVLPSVVAGTIAPPLQNVAAQISQATGFDLSGVADSMAKFSQTLDETPVSMEAP